MKKQTKLFILCSSVQEEKSVLLIFIIKSLSFSLCYAARAQVGMQMNQICSSNFNTDCQHFIAFLCPDITNISTWVAVVTM